MNSPETIIRRYLDEHGGRVEAHIRHLTDSWELKEAEAEDLEEIRGALAKVGVETDPPLPDMASDGRVTLFVADAEKPRGEPRHGTRRRSTTGVRSIAARVRGQAEVDVQATKPSAVVEADPPAPPQGPPPQAPRPPAAEEAPRQPSSPAVAELLDGLLGPDQQRRLEERLEELSTGREALKERLDSVRDALEGVNAVARRKISEIEQAAGQAERPAEDAGARLSELQQRLTSLQASDEESGASQEELVQTILRSEREQRLESLFGALVEAEQAAQEARERREAESARLEAELVEAQQGVSAARAAADETLANPELRSQLDARLSALAEAEQREGELHSRRAEEAERWTGELSDLRRRAGEAREALQGELSDSEQGAQAELRLTALIEAEREGRGALAEAAEALAAAQEELTRQRDWAAGADGRLDALLAADRDTAQAIDRERAQTESIRAELDQRIAEVRDGIVQTILGAERRGELQERLEAFVSSWKQEHDAELDAARSELERVKLQAEEWLSGVRDRLSESQAELAKERDARAQSEARVAELGEEAEQRRSELEGIGAELAGAREELERERGDREQLEQRVAALGEQEEQLRSELEASRAEAESGRQDLARLEREAGELRADVQQRMADSDAEHAREVERHEAELTAARQELEAARTDHERRMEEARREQEHQLDAVRSEQERQLDAVRSEHARQLDEANQAAERQRQELEAAAEMQHEAEAALQARVTELEELRAQRAGALTSLSESMRSVEQATEDLAGLRTQVAAARAEEERLQRAVEAAEGRLEEKRGAVAEAQARHAEASERRGAMEQRIAALKAERQQHQQACEQRRANLKGLDGELVQTLSEIEDRVGRTEEQSRLVSEAQRAAASALFKDSEEAAAQERELHEAIDREQSTRRALEADEARVRRLHAEIADAERLLTKADEAATEAGRELEAETTGLGRLEAELPKIADEERQAAEAVESELSEVEALSGRLVEAREAVQEADNRAREHRAQVARAQEELQAEVRRQAAGMAEAPAQT